MKKLLYLATMLFNFTGVLFSTGLIFVCKSALLTYLPLILFSIAIFMFAFAITFLDFNNKTHHQKIRYICHKPQITDYREFFAEKRSEFTV